MTNSEINNTKINSTTSTVLIVDDEKDVRELYKINLQRLGYKTFTASNSDEAINICKQSLEKHEPILFAIVDLSLPGDITGKDIAKILRNLNSDILTIVSSGDTECPEMIYYQEHGFDAALEKNFNRDAIKQVLEKLLI